MSTLVHLKSKSGTIYVYENISYWDEDAGKVKSKRKCIGHLDPETREVVPNGKRGGYQRKQAPKRKKAAPTCAVSSFGESLLFDRVCADIGLDAAVREHFPDRWQEILTCAYYLASEGRSLSRAEQWSRIRTTPTGKALTGQEIAALLSGFTPELVRTFTAGWAARHRNEALTCLCIDCALPGLMDEDRFTDEPREAPGSLLVLSGQENHLPLFCWSVPGQDISTLTRALDRRGVPEGDGVLLTLDRRYDGEAQRKALWDSGRGFVLELSHAAPTEREAELSEFQVLGERYLAHTQEGSRDGQRCWLHTCVSKAALAARAQEAEWSHLLSNTVSDPARALTLLRQKTATAQFLEDLLYELEHRRLWTQTPESVNGRLFLQWLALTIRARIFHVLSVNGCLSRLEVQQVIDEMKGLCIVEPSGKAKRASTPLTPRQEEIGALFGLEFG